MLEAYCRGCGQYMKELSSQLTALNKMKHVTDTLQNVGKKKTDEVLKYLGDQSFTSAMENITSPLDPSIHVKKLRCVYTRHRRVHVGVVWVERTVCYMKWCELSQAVHCRQSQ